jgi:hypothetical protein
MKADYLVLGDGSSVRVEWNMNALAMVTSLTGKGMADLLGKTTDMALLRTIAWCCAVEGEFIEGREYKLSEIEFGRLMNMRSIAQFSVIFTEQIVRDPQKKSELKEKKPKVIIR